MKNLANLLFFVLFLSTISFAQMYSFSCQCKLSSDANQLKSGTYILRLNSEIGTSNQIFEKQ